MHIENNEYDDALHREVGYGRIKTYQVYNEELKLWAKNIYVINAVSREKLKLVSKYI